MYRILFTLLIVYASFVAVASAMTPDEFAETTQRVIAGSGFDGFQPTAIYPARRHIMGYDGFPANLPDQEQRILLWATKEAGKDEEFLVAFKIDQTHFKIIRCIGTKQTDSKIYAVR